MITGLALTEELKVIIVISNLSEALTEELKVIIVISNLSEVKSHLGTFV